MITLPKCPVETTLIFLGDRVKFLIVGYLLKEPLQPIQLRDIIGVISEDSLNRKLEELEGLGVIERKDNEKLPTKVVYSLTELGKSFCNIIETMEAWGEQYKASISYK